MGRPVTALAESELFMEIEVHAYMCFRFDIALLETFAASTLQT